MNVKQLFDLHGKVALVTGGSGLFGRQIAQALAEAGAITTMASRNTAKLSAQSDHFRAQGLDVRVASLDQSSEASINALKDQLLADYGRIDVLVNNSVCGR